MAEEADDPATIGRRLRRIRHARGKSLDVIAGLAGISEGHLSRIERGERALDSASLIAGLANALEVAPSELTRLPVPAPANGEMDSAVAAVSGAVMAANRDQPGGLVLPIEALREQVRAALDAYCRDGLVREVGAALPGLIRDVHTSIAAGRDVADLLDLAVLLHVQVTVGWLRIAGASVELREHAVLLARRAAERRDTPTARGLAVYGGLYVAVAAGAFDLAQGELDAVSVPTNSPESTQLAGMLALSRSFLAAAAGRPGDVAAPLDHAAELAERTGQGNAYWLGFGPQEVGQWRAFGVLELGEHERAVSITESLQPKIHPLRGDPGQAAYWVTYGRALARLRGRRDDAARALRRAETLVPHAVQRNSLAREVLGELVAHAKPDSLSRELRGMVYRAGLSA